MDSSPRDPAHVKPKPSCGMGNRSLILPPCRGPSQAIVWIFLGILQHSSITWPPCFSKCFPRIFLLCLPLQKKRLLLVAFYFFKFVYINTWQVPGTAALPRFLLLAQALVYLLDASGSPNPDSTVLGVVQPRLGKMGPVRKSCN